MLRGITVVQIRTEWELKISMILKLHQNLSTDLLFPMFLFLPLVLHVSSPILFVHIRSLCCVKILISDACFLDKSNKYASKAEVNNAIVTILNKKSISTPSLPDAAETTNPKVSIASTEQAASADNLAAKVSVS